MSVRARVRTSLLLLAAVASCRAPAGHDAAHGVQQVPVAAFDVERYSIRIDIDPKTRSIAASCKIRVWPTVARLERVELDFDGLDVHAVRDGDGQALRWSRAEGRLAVELRAPVPRGTSAEFTVEYGGQPERGLWFARERGGVPTEIFTHGECRDARAWFPCRDEPDERAISEIQVTMPRAWTSIAAGERLERTEDGERATERWRMTFPHPAYLETLVAGELCVVNDEWDGVPLAYAGPEESKANLRTVFADTGACLEFFSQVTGARYPYAKYAQACVDNFPFGGMENISATTMTDAMLPDEEDLADSDTSELVAHEAAHQWFGDLLTCKDWSHAWLNEGFATYFAALYTERKLGVDAFRREMRGLRDGYLARDVGPNRRPIVYGTADDPLELFFSGHVYQGAAVRLHHLRSVLGDDVFFRGIQRYVEMNRGRGVVTDDLRVAMEQVSRLDLRWFFEQWFERPGFPVVTSSWTWDESAHVAHLVLEQTQDPDGGAATLFRLPIDVEVRTHAGSRLERIVLGERRQRFEFDCAESPEWIRVDPGDDVPMRLDERMQTRHWLAMVERADASGRARAAGVLARALRELKPGDEVRAIRAALVGRLELDPAPEVRKLCLVAAIPEESPGASGSSPERPRHAPVELMRKATVDPEQSVRAAAYETMRDAGPDIAIARFARQELEHAEGWKLRGAIVALVARSDPARAFDFLVHELETRSAHGVWEARILAELAALKDPRCTAILLDWASDATKPDAARSVAVRELARVPMEPAARAAIIALLDSPRVRLRREAIAALSRCSDASARAALERHARATRIPGERRAAERALATTASDS